MKKKTFFLLTLVVVVSLSKLFSQDPIIGDWKGVSKNKKQEFEIIFHISKNSDNYITTMDIPKHGAIDIKIKETKFIGSKIILKMSENGVLFEGELKDNVIKGLFSMGEDKADLLLNKFENKLPGNTSLVSADEELKKLENYDKGNYKYQVSDYFSRPKATSFRLSPKGKYLSYKEKGSNNKTNVYVKEISTGKVKMAIEEKKELIATYGWINENRLVFFMDKGGDENYHVFATNIDGSNTKDLTPFEGVKASIISLLEEDEDHVIIYMNKNNRQVMEPYKLNVSTGELVQLFKNEDMNNPISDFKFDRLGELRAYTKVINGIENEIYYKDLKTGEFNLIKRLKWYDSFSIIDFNYTSKNKNEAYIVSNLDSDKSRILLYDLKENKILKELYSNPSFDVNGISIAKKNRNYEIDIFYYVGDRAEIVPVSKMAKDIYSLMKKEFGDKDFRIVSSDDDENTMLITVNSDKLYGKYYIYDVKNKKITLLYDLMPQLREEDMVEMRPIKFKSRDGFTIYGYITLPKESSGGKKVPLIVNPHGGPQGVRDYWGFNPEVQLFASRGYATLQVNFRISGGYGKKFLREGFKQVGRKVMDDIEDGVKYCLEQGWVDESKIAIYGASHGGYATLMGLIKTPDLYSCGVDYVGVSNIETLFSSIPEYWKPYKKMLYEVWYDLDDPEELKIAKSVSPINQVDKIKKPVFVVQGANDPRVNIAESDQIVSVLRKKGFYTPYMVKYNEGHGFRREENSLELYKYMLGFFRKNFNKE